MFSKCVGIVLSMVLLSGCVMVPEVKFSDTIEFNALPPSQQPVGYADLLCCFDCTV